MTHSDTLTQVGAERLCVNIKAYWIGQGYEVNPSLYFIKEAGFTRYRLCGIRSDMVNGKPVRRIA